MACIYTRPLFLFMALALASTAIIPSDLFFSIKYKLTPRLPLRLFRLIPVSTVAVRPPIKDCSPPTMKITWAPSQKPVDVDRVAIIERLVQEAVDAFMDFFPAVADIRSYTIPLLGYLD